MNYSKEMSRVTEPSTCLTSAQVLCDSSWHWEQPGWILGGIAASLTENQLQAAEMQTDFIGGSPYWAGTQTHLATGLCITWLDFFFRAMERQLSNLFRSPEQSPDKESQHSNWLALCFPWRITLSFLWLSVCFAEYSVGDPRGYTGV